MNEERRITITEERYKELIKMEAKLELVIEKIKADKYFSERNFMKLFGIEYKEDDE